MKNPVEHHVKHVKQHDLEVILASLLASSELRMLLADLEERRLQEPEHYADEAPELFRMAFQCF